MLWAPARPLFDGIVARTSAAMAAGSPATGMPDRLATLDRLIPAALWLMPR